MIVVMKKTFKMIAVAGALGCLFALSATATSITYVTGSTATDSSGDPVSAYATFVTSQNTVSITLGDLLADPKDVGQLISDLSFTLSSGQTAGMLTSSSGQQITVNGDGSSTLGATGSTT
jgi:hypothetical protein